MKFRFRYKKIKIGLRTIKTAAAVMIAMMIVSAYGTTSSKLIFAMLGAMAAMEHTFYESVQACLTQVVGVFFGAAAGVVLMSLPLHFMISTGIGIILVITIYNVMHVRFSPSLPCLIILILCTTPDIQPFTYAMGRIWDTAIGLLVGLLINTLVFPYDSRNKIRALAETIDEEVILFLEDLFDGDTHIPNTENTIHMIDDMTEQLGLFKKQWLLLKKKGNEEEYLLFSDFQAKARQLVARMEVLCQMQYPGRLTEENRELLKKSGALIKDQRIPDEIKEEDVVTNYHVRKILELRQELIAILREKGLGSPDRVGK